MSLSLDDLKSDFLSDESLGRNLIFKNPESFLTEVEVDLLVFVLEL